MISDLVVVVVMIWAEQGEGEGLHTMLVATSILYTILAALLCTNA
jgi:hypothetical protein